MTSSRKRLDSLVIAAQPLTDMGAVRLEHRLAGLVEQEGNDLLSSRSPASSPNCKISPSKVSTSLLMRSVRSDAWQDHRLANASATETRMTENAHALAQAIKVAARVHALKELAARTFEAYRQALAASGLPEEHFRLRLMLLGSLLPPPPRKGA